LLSILVTMPLITTPNFKNRILKNIRFILPYQIMRDYKINKKLKFEVKLGK